MRKITAITAQERRKDRVNLFIDGEFFAGVSAETVLKLRLKAGDEVNSERLAEILAETERTEAVQKAADYALKTLKTKRQIKDYLLRKGYSEEAVRYAVDKLKEYGYIDDKEYSIRFIESTSKTQGRRLAEYKLMMKGVKKEDIAAAYESAETDGNASARALCEKYLKNKEKTRENVLKAYKYLIGRGFTYEQADYAVALFKED
ncbi:MAG: RecX family transcriptional regulator [Clostridia bacterium]|nr:RecX family transcriptional regulator [Clostridia bacterium]